MPDLATIFCLAPRFLAMCAIALSSAPREVVAADEATVPKAADDGFKPLFNHVDLSGWRQSFGDDDEVRWTVRDGALHCRRTMSETEFNLVCDKTLPTDFALRFSWKRAPGQDDGDFPDGMFLLVSSAREFVDGPPAAPQTRYKLTSVIDFCAGGNLVQIRTLPIVVNELTEEFRGGAHSREAAESASLRPPGEWNHAEILVRGATIEYKLNDRTIQSIDFADLEERKKADEFSPLAEHWLARKRAGHRLAISPVGSEASYGGFRLKDLTATKP